MQVGCGFCGCPTALWGVKDAKAGRWVRIKKQIGVLPDGTPIEEPKMIPLIKTLKVCGACAEAYLMLKAATVAAGRPEGLAFLPLS